MVGEGVVEENIGEEDVEQVQEPGSLKDDLEKSIFLDQIDTEEEGKNKGEEEVRK